MKKQDDTKRNQSRPRNEDKATAPKQPLSLDVEVLEERIAPGFLSGLRFGVPTGWQLQDCCD